MINDHLKGLNDVKAGNMVTVMLHVPITVIFWVTQTIKHIITFGALNAPNFSHRHP